MKLKHSPVIVALLLLAANCLGQTLTLSHQGFLCPGQDHPWVSGDVTNSVNHLSSQLVGYTEAGGFVTLADNPQRSVARVVQSPQSVVPSPPKPITLNWDYDSRRRWEVSHFRVYSNTTLAPAPWPLWVTTTNQFISFLTTNTSRFFYCTAFGVNGTESIPNTK